MTGVRRNPVDDVKKWTKDPNLQNIPVRSEEARRISAAFREPLMTDLDYSQTGCRLVALLRDRHQHKEAPREVDPD